jgi:hypothetical protein
VVCGPSSVAGPVKDGNDPLIEEVAQIAERIGMPVAAKYRAEAEELRAGV